MKIILIFHMDYIQISNPALARDLIWAEKRIIETGQNVENDGTEVKDSQNLELSNQLKLIAIVQNSGIQKQNDNIIELLKNNIALLKQNNDKQQEILNILASYYDPKCYNDTEEEEEER